MRDEDDTHRVIETRQRAHELFLGVCIKGSGRFIEHEKARTLQKRTGDANTLSLASGKPTPAGASSGIETLGQAFEYEFSSRFM